MPHILDRPAPLAAEFAQIHAAAMKDGVWSEASFADLCAQPGVFAVADPAAGFILLRAAADECEILTFAVTPERQRKGLGAALLQDATKAARARGAVSIFLEVAEDNAPALLLYRCRGFTEAGRRKGYYRNRVDAVVMRKPLE